MRILVSSSAFPAVATLRACYQILFSLLFVACLLFEVPLLNAASTNEFLAYTVEGTVISKIIVTNKVVSTETSHFHVSGCTNRWKVRIRRNPDEPSFNEAIFDGQYVYTTSRFKDRPDRNQVAHTVIYDKRSFPPMDMPPAMRPVFFGFASGQYFQTKESKLVEPAIRAGLDFYLDPQNVYPLKAEWDLFTNAPFLPKWIVYLDDGVTPKDGSKGKKRPPPFDRGFTNISYSVSSTTNIDGCVFPLEARLKGYRLVRNAKTFADLKQCVEFNFAVTNVIAGRPKIIISEVYGRTAVSDYRFGNKANYFVTNGLRETTELLGSPEFQKKYREMEKEVLKKEPRPDFPVF